MRVRPFCERMESGATVWLGFALTGTDVQFVVIRWVVGIEWGARG